MEIRNHDTAKPLRLVKLGKESVFLAVTLLQLGIQHFYQPQKIRVRGICANDLDHKSSNQPKVMPNRLAVKSSALRDDRGFC